MGRAEGTIETEPQRLDHTISPASSFLAWLSDISWLWSRDFRKRPECGRACLKCDRPTSLVHGARTFWGGLIPWPDATLWGISTVGQARAAFAVRIIWGARVPELQDQADGSTVKMCRLCQKRFLRFDNADWSLKTRKAQNVSASFSTTHRIHIPFLILSSTPAVLRR